MAVEWKGNPLAIGAAHVAGAAMVAYAFAVVLMTASLQSHVADALASLRPQPLEYSTAYAMWKKSQQIDGEIRQLARQRADAAGLRDEAESKAHGAADELLVLEAPLHTLADRLNARGCRIDLGDSYPEQIARALAELRHCIAESPQPEAIRGELQAILDSPDLLTNARAWVLYDREKKRHERAIEDYGKRSAALASEQTTLRQAREAFDSMSVLERRWLIGGSAMTELPPAIVQILLAFVSGMFGALLLTLIFVVYPNNNLGLATSTKYAPRVLLGGLISVCVFIVLGGGTAVLGTSSPLAEGETNFLAMCAIGILAGMFSDLVAAWLWERAKEFFGQPNGAGGSVSKGAGGHPSGPAAGPVPAGT